MYIQTREQGAVHTGIKGPPLSCTAAAPPSYATLKQQHLGLVLNAVTWLDSTSSGLISPLSVKLLEGFGVGHMAV